MVKNQTFLNTKIYENPFIPNIFLKIIFFSRDDLFEHFWGGNKQIIHLGTIEIIVNVGGILVKSPMKVESSYSSRKIRFGGEKSDFIRFGASKSGQI